MLTWVKRKKVPLFLDCSENLFLNLLQCYFLAILPAGNIIIITVFHYFFVQRKISIFLWKFQPIEVLRFSIYPNDQAYNRNIIIFRRYISRFSFNFQISSLVLQYIWVYLKYLIITFITFEHIFCSWNRHLCLQILGRSA